MELNFAETDTAINRVIPWRDTIPLKVFASQIRFQIRLDDIREIVRGNTTTVDEVLDFYNQIIDALLDQYSSEFKVVSGSGTWKQMIVYKNILRAIDNIGINAAYVSKYYIQGILKDAEMAKYLRAQILAIEYLNQASNFSPRVRRLVARIQDGKNYKLLQELWDDVEDATTTVDTNNETEVRLFSINLYRISLAYLDEIRSIELNQLGKLRYFERKKKSGKTQPVKI